MIYFIVNPISGSGKGKVAVPVIDKIMKDSGEAYFFVYTERPGDIERVAGLIDVDAAKAIVCVGGDGTLQEYVGLAVNRGIPFGVIPTGSGNDFVNSLPIEEPRFPSFEKKIAYYTDKLLVGATTPVDVVEVNTGTFFLNIGGTGIDIQVVQDALPLKKYFAGGAYFFSLVKNALLGHAEEMSLTTDERTEKNAYLLLAICNGSYYGGHMHIAPPASIDDGFLTLCIIKKMSRLKLAALFPLVKPGWHVGFKEVSFVQCTSATLEFQGKKTVNFDGNLLECESPLTFQIIKGAVRFII